MVGREGDVVLRMEIPSGDFEGEGEEEESVEDGEDGAAVGNGEGAVGWAEVFLEIDHQQCRLENCCQVGHGGTQGGWKGKVTLPESTWEVYIPCCRSWSPRITAPWEVPFAFYHQCRQIYQTCPRRDMLARCVWAASKASNGLEDVE